MEKKLLFLFAQLLFAIASYSQPNSVVFDFDAAGNQIKRYAVYSSRLISNNQPPKDLETLLESDMEGAGRVKYYPNPVKGELYVSWSSDQITVSKIVITTITGNYVGDYIVEKNMTKYAIPFEQYAEGIYVITLVSDKDTTESFKIIKR